MLNLVISKFLQSYWQSAAKRTSGVIAVAVVDWLTYNRKRKHFSSVLSLVLFTLLSYYICLERWGFVGSRKHFYSFFILFFLKKKNILDPKLVEACIYIPVLRNIYNKTIYKISLCGIFKRVIASQCSLALQSGLTSYCYFSKGQTFVSVEVGSHLH